MTNNIWLRWQLAPKEHGVLKTIHNRWKRWSDNGVFALMMTGLAAEHDKEKTVRIDATYLKAHPTGTAIPLSIFVKFCLGGFTLLVQ